MPGPRNSKKKKRAQAQREKEKRSKTTAKDAEDQHIPYQPLRSQPLRYSYDKHILTTHDTRLHHLSDEHSLESQPYLRDSIYVYDPQPADVHEPALPEPTCLPIDPAHLSRPCVEDTGDGLRVRNVLSFVFDSRLASPPSLDDALCAELAQDEVLDMLCAVLPEERATILWYNKTRVASRICPVCKRLYRLGDTLESSSRSHSRSPPRTGSHSPHRETKSAHAKAKRHREQEISGICSALCFFLAAHTFPTALRALWGRSASELDPHAAAALSYLPRVDANADPEHLEEIDERESLGTLLKMTRCSDLGLQQIFFAEVDISGATSGESDDTDHDAQR